MGLFKKEHGVDVLDLTLLQKKGLLHVPPSPQRGADILDMTLPHPRQQALPSSATLSSPSSPLSFFDVPQPTTSSGASPSNTPLADNPFGMLDTLASSASQLPQSSAAGANASADTVAFNALKIKLDDLEFKLERLVEKFSLLDERLQARSPQDTGS
jgi:hypothetical protein